jgi:hypothetical protein
MHGETVTGFDIRVRRKVVMTESGKEIAADLVVAAIGIRPQPRAGARCRAASGRRHHRQPIPANQPTRRFLCRRQHHPSTAPCLICRLRLEHEDAATSMGETAGRNMAGAAEPMIICPSSTPTCSTLGMKRLAGSIRSSNPSPIGKNRTKKE